MSIRAFYLALGITIGLISGIILMIFASIISAQEAVQPIAAYDSAAFAPRYATSTLSIQQIEEIAFYTENNNALIAEVQKTNALLRLLLKK